MTGNRNDGQNEILLVSRQASWMGLGLPSAWQGWVVLVVYVAALAAANVFFSPVGNAPAFYAWLVIATAALLLVCLLKGEPPRWRSGGE